MFTIVNASPVLFVCLFVVCSSWKVQDLYYFWWRSTEDNRCQTPQFHKANFNWAHCLVCVFARVSTWPILFVVEVMRSTEIIHRIRSSRLTEWLQLSCLTSNDIKLKTTLYLNQSSIWYYVDFLFYRMYQEVPLMTLCKGVLLATAWY